MADLTEKVVKIKVIGVGGGKVIDTAKAVVTNLGGYQLVIIPTVASNDSPCSGVAVIYNDEGVVIKALMMKRNPDLVLVDTACLQGIRRQDHGTRSVLQHRSDDVQAVL